MQELFHCYLPNRCPIKKNTAKRYRFGVVYSDAYKAWEKESIPIMRIEKMRQGIFKPIDYPIQVKAIFFYASHQWESDLSNALEGPNDLLTKCGIITDDKLIYSLDGSRKIFGQKPGLLLSVYKFEE